jgi:predicted AAA+ superfamily ATPase
VVTSNQEVKVLIRYAMGELIKWKTSISRKPMIIRGARQVGKTWLMKEFGQTQYQKTAYINFDNNERMQSLFSGNYDITRIITALKIESGVNINASDTLIIFDEVQEVPAALTSLKYFNENAPEYHIMAAGSLLGVAMHPNTSFPVGKVDFLELHPLSFLEYLLATGNEALVNLLISKDFDLIKNFRSKLIDILKEYYFVGGMPEVVVTFINSRDYEETRKVQQRILLGYEQDFSKHAPTEIVPRIRMLWSSIPSQLAKENRKFLYGMVKQGARAREYELAMTWLIDSGLIYKINRISKPGMPISAYQDLSAFKIYLLDVGLLAAISDIDVMSLLKGNEIFEEFKGALTEQYVLQQLITNNNKMPHYWSADAGTAEVDFIIQKGAEVIPVEVKAAENLQSKSLKSYCQKYSPKTAIRTSLSDYREEDWLVNLPLYAIGSLTVTS